ATITQNNFLIRSIESLEDTLLSKLFPRLQISASSLQWYKLTPNGLRSKYVPILNNLEKLAFKCLCIKFLPRKHADSNVQIQN
ncbi:hypothetical protein BDF20DRAFT_812391, partial [Mycotypha africana]|uniref:uncharacterized protein n=1 Tax=Mycotypha africana TaxID=64632 RepID=UPI00230021D8